MSTTHRADASPSSPWPRATPLVVAFGLLLASGVAASHPPAPPVAERPAGVDGAVRDGDRPVESARVYAYEVASFALKQVLTDRHGRFRFDSLPAGLYKIVAHKDGFLPTVHLLIRRTAEDRQSVDLRLLEDAPGEVRDAEGYWDARAQVPADVLREIHLLPEDRLAQEAVTVPGLVVPAAFRATMGAQSGLESLGGEEGEAHRTAAQLGLHGDIGSMEIGFKGRYEQLAPRQGGLISDGEVRAMALSVESAERSSLRVATASAQLPAPHADPEGVDLERYQVAWEGATGETARTSVSARFTEQSNFFRAGWVDPTTIPMSSRSWEVEGSYHRALGSGNLRTGLSYQQVEGESAYGFGEPEWTLDQQSLGFYGIADTRLGSRVLVEYGLFSTLRDGGMSLMPHGGVVLELGKDWTARGTVAQRVEAEPAEGPYAGFTTALFGDGETCRRVGELCYEVAFSRSGDDDDMVRIGAVHREIAETLRLYFSDDFFDRLESLFLVRGDQLPEVQFAMARRVSPRVLARLESNYAEGGGGIFYATDSQAYENQVRYLVTSLDTQLQSTSTGIFIAFHHLRQALEPVVAQRSTRDAELEVERLQVMLTQDLGLLMDVSSTWAVRFNMELSRGNTPYRLQADDELYKKLTGGFTVSF